MSTSFNYQSKKSGQSYLYTTTTVFAEPQDAYAWKRGVREYADNYTADHKLRNRDGTRAWPGTDAEYAEKAHELNTEAHTRFAIGDVPHIGDSTPSPIVVAAANLARNGVNVTELANVPASELAAWLESRKSNGLST